MVAKNLGESVLSVLGTPTSFQGFVFLSLYIWILSVKAEAARRLLIRICQLAVLTAILACKVPFGDHPFWWCVTFILWGVLGQVE